MIERKYGQPEIDGRRVIAVWPESRTIIYGGTPKPPYVERVKYEQNEFEYLLGVLREATESLPEPGERWQEWEVTENGVFSYGKLQRVLKLRLKTGETL